LFEEVLVTDEVFGGSRAALEEAFFARENERLRQQLRDLDNTKRKKEALAAASGITNDTVLEKLAALNISSETVAALALVPLIAIAWSDGSIDDKKRAAVFARPKRRAYHRAMSAVNYSSGGFPSGLRRISSLRGRTMCGHLWRR
jgi:hypothetical protein